MQGINVRKERLDMRKMQHRNEDWDADKKAK